MPQRVLSSHCYAFFTVLLWSSAYVFSKVTLQYFTSPSLGFLRCAVAAVVLLALVCAKRIAPPSLSDTPLFVLSGAMGFALYLLVFNRGLESLNPTTSCILISTSPIITAALAWFFFRERLTLMGWAATFLAFCGVLLLTLWDNSLTVSWGVLWMMTAALFISVYSILQRKLARKYSALQITAYSFLFATLLLLYFLPEAARQMRAAPLSQAALVVFLGIFPSAIAYLCWTKALSLAATVSSVTNYMFLTPFLALLLEYVVIGELPGTGTFLGGATILSSLLLFVKAGK